jgi:hypothetical protein
MNAGILIIAREKYFGPSFHYSNIPVNPPNLPLIKEGGGGIRTWLLHPDRP